MKSIMPATLLAALVAFVVALTPASAIAQAGVRGGSGIMSPEVAQDGSVTFRLQAPEAESVTVESDFGDPVELTKDDEGIWSATVGPLDPEMYIYYFMVDGVRVLDPSNPQVKVGYVTSTTVSLLTVPTPESAFYAVRDVPHGEIRTLLYPSKSNGVVRELTVYLPPGYDDNPDQRYPVLYLLHGYANDHNSWHRYGRANDILDNLLAEGSIDPFIVVMPLGYGGASVNGDGFGIPPENASAMGGDADLYERDILEDIIPMIDGKYRTIADRTHRAIVGFSMGGGQAGRYGLGNLDTFSYVGIMSAGLGGGGGGTETGPLAAVTADPAASNELIDLLWIACGVDDTAMAGAMATHEALEEAGIEHTFLETEGAHHWRVWRRYLRDLSPLLFQE